MPRRHRQPAAPTVLRDLGKLAAKLHMLPVQVARLLGKPTDRGMTIIFVPTLLALVMGDASPNLLMLHGSVVLQEAKAGTLCQLWKEGREETEDLLERKLVLIVELNLLQAVEPRLRGDGLTHPRSQGTGFAREHVDVRKRRVLRREHAFESSHTRTESTIVALA